MNRLERISAILVKLQSRPVVTASEIAEQFGQYLGEGLAAIACVTNPEAFVIGGGVSKAGSVLIDYIRPYYQKVVFHADRDVKFELATLGNDAGIYGSVRLVLPE